MYHPRHIEDKLQALARFHKVILLNGARQVGKSTLLTQLYPHLQHLTFDPLQDIYGARSDPDLFLKTFPSPIILDEVQYVPELLPSIKRLVDQKEEKGQYFLTGSQNFMMLKTVSESLAGRVGILNLYPMTLLEMYNHSTHWIDLYLQRDPNFYQNLKLLSSALSLFECIWRGGMPGLVESEDDAIPNTLESYFRTYIERDIRTAGNIQNLQNFSLFTRLLASNTAQEVNLAHLGREIGISNPTAIEWKNLLQSTYFWLEIPAYHHVAVKRVSHKPKGYMMDTGMACHLQRITTIEALAQYPGRGSLFETYGVHQLYAYLQKKPSPPQFYHWRTSNQAEIDLVIEQDGWLFPIEFKCKTTLSGHDARWFKSFQESHPHARVFKGIIIYAGDVVRHVTENVIAIPWNYLPQV